ncbi:putative beta-barrel porin 2 [Enterobacillus tribolii]|uniref:Putative beta-barrel porin 2 n=2 Tax=Enterobacillus tribolii TaxID=1487935 RepID=A0A370QPU1_9GAMM|nr:putative beta-barrel porin 2 [Enterobacillus tribolii]
MKTHTSVLLAAGLAAMPPAWALPVPKSHTGIAGIDFQGQISAGYGQVSNVTYQPWSRNETSSAFQSVNPMFRALGERGEDRYQLMYSGDYRAYNQASADNYADHFFRFAGQWRYGQMQGLSLTMEDTLGHENRGRGITEGFLPEQFRAFGVNSPLKTRFLSSELRYSFGAPEGRGKAEAALLYKQLRFGNTDEVRDADTDFYNYIRDQEWHEPSLVVELFDMYSKTTRFRYSFITNQRRYETSSLKDSNEYYLLYGFKSQLTGKTSVDANVSWLYKTFINEPNAQDFSGLNWDIKAEWKPLDYSTVALHSAQRIKDPSEAGGYIQVTEYGLSWTHHWWVDRFSTTVDYSYVTEDYKKQADNRKDKDGLLTLSASYDFRPSVNVEMKYQMDTMRSNKKTDAFYIGPDYGREVDRTLGYDNQMIMLTARVQI